MFAHHLKVAFRHVRENKVVSLINISGLAVGIIACLLIAHYVKVESNFDTFYQDADRIYRIAWQNDKPQTLTPHPIAQAMAADFPEVESAASLTPIWGIGLTQRSFSVVNPENEVQFNEKEILAVDSTFFDVFDFPIMYGDGKLALSVPGGLVLTESTAKRYFSKVNPIGKRLIVNGEVGLEVKAVIKDIPRQNHFHFDMLVSYLTMTAGDENDPFFAGQDFGHYNYIKLSPNAHAASVEEKLPKWLLSSRFIHSTHEEIDAFGREQIDFKLQALNDIPLNSYPHREPEPNGPISYVYLMSAAAIFILVIACVNFVNLTTARSVERAKAIGMRKTLGAMRKHLSWQFLAESLLISFMGLMIAMIAVQFILPYFNHASGLTLTIDEVLSPLSLSYLCLGVILVGIISGLYPALFLFSFKPSAILRGSFKPSKQGGWLRKSLVVFQFSIAIALILGSIIIFDQLNYLTHKKLGFEQEQVMMIPVQHDNLREKTVATKQKMNDSSEVSRVSPCSKISGSSFNPHTFWKIWKKSDVQCQLRLPSVLWIITSSTD